MAVVIPDAITTNGWSEYERCVCTGIKKIKFRHPSFPTYELEWWCSYHQFKVMNGNTTKVPLTRILFADETLKALT